MEPVESDENETKPTEATIPSIITEIVDVDFEILSKLEDRELLKICQLSVKNRYINSICGTRRPQFWKQRIVSRFGEAALQYVKNPENRKSYAHFYLTVIYLLDKKKTTLGVLRMVP